jgi:hypothetical protein
MSDNDNRNASNLEDIKLSLQELVLVTKRLAHAVEQIQIMDESALRGDPCESCGSQLVPEVSDNEAAEQACPACGEHP